MANLYEVNRELLACIDPDTGEILDIEKFENLSISKSQKIENIALYIKNLQADALAFETEGKAFAERKAKAQKKIESLQRYLSDVLAGENFSTKKCVVSFRRSQKLEVTNTAQIPKEFIKYETTESVDKNAVKAAIKAGQAVEGCRIVENFNISVK
jgi:hypothetical protein